MSYILDFSPRRIWLGLTIPGKKMMRLLGGGGRDLLNIYQEDADSAIIITAKAIHEIPNYGAEFGPRAADVRKPLEPYMFYGAILTDVRDFLKLRFRAESYGLADLVNLGVPVDTLQLGQLPEIDDGNPLDIVLSHTLNYVISTLDDLSSNSSRDTDQIRKSLIHLRDVLLNAHGLVAPIVVKGQADILNDFFGENLFSVAEEEVDTAHRKPRRRNRHKPQ